VLEEPPADDGESRGADQDVAIARERGIPVYTALREVPGVA
jgi:hypothetical protein